MDVPELLQERGRFMEVITTHSDESKAQQIAKCLVEERLAACVQVEGPVTSHYRWDGKVQVDREYVIIVKTTSERCETLTRRLIAMHDYDLPQLWIREAAAVEILYGKWIESETR